MPFTFNQLACPFHVDHSDMSSILNILQLKVVFVRKYGFEHVVPTRRRPRKGSRKGFTNCPVAKGLRSPLGCLLRSSQTQGVAWSLANAANMMQNTGKVQSRKLCGEHGCGSRRWHGPPTTVLKSGSIVGCLCSMAWLLYCAARSQAQQRGSQNAHRI